MKSLVLMAVSAVAVMSAWECRAQSAVVNIQPQGTSPIPVSANAAQLTPYANYLMIGQWEDVPGGGGLKGFYTNTGVVPLTFFATAQELRDTAANIRASVDVLANGQSSVAATQLRASVDALSLTTSQLAASNAQLVQAAAALTATQRAMEARYARLDDKLSAGVAIAGVMDIPSPGPGASNRVGGAVGVFRDKEAFAINMSHRAGQFDFGLAAGAASGAGMGKASMGVSW